MLRPSGQSVSTDRGRTWSALTPDQPFRWVTKPALMLTSTGVLVFAFSGVKVSASLDEGETWRPPVEVDRVHGYPWMVELDPGRILLLYHDDDAPHLKRCEKAELKAMQFQVTAKGEITDVSKPWVILGSGAAPPYTHPAYVCAVKLAKIGAPSKSKGKR
jgi:hypothetical protein